MDIFKSLTIPSIGEDVQQQKVSCSASGSVNCYNHLGKTVSQYHIKLKIPYLMTSNSTPSYTF